MYSTLTELQKMEMRSLYWSGTPIREICKKYEISKTTAYYWVSPVRQQEYASKLGNNILIQKEFSNLQKKLKRMQTIVEVLETANCNINSPIDERLSEFERLSPIYGKNVVLEALNISKGTYHNRVIVGHQPTCYEEHHRIISNEVQKIFDESKQCYGADKIFSVLQSRGYQTSKKFVLGIMHELGLKSIRVNSRRMYLRKKKKNVVKRQFKAERPNQVWVSDITQFPVKGIYYYICVIIDLYSRKVVAYKISPNASARLVTSTFRKAYANSNNPSELIFHSDQGTQFTSRSFRMLLANCNVTQSFSFPGTPIDNAVAESFFSILKQEELYRYDYRSEREFLEHVAKYIEHYNSERPHRYNNYISPDVKEQNYYKKNRE